MGASHAPLVLSSHLRQLAFGVNHLPERFGLFTIIALGENVVSVGARVGGRRLGTTELAAVALAFRTGCGPWWLYFRLAASAFAHVLRPRPRCRMDAVVREGMPLGEAGANSPLEAPPWAKSRPPYSSAACPDSSTRRASARSSSSEDGMKTTRC
ncbi:MULTISPECIES: low temperature requirement protein A [unclassified Streptomyces]|uniref:low temperature requirement protein A n=1 Tax=unclassified Streptomyces TaxID=2593676 RepID=UPI0031F89514